MNLELSEEASEYGRLARRAFEAAGGDALVQQAEEQPERREQLVAPVFAELGVWDLDARGDAGELEAAAAVCRSAGYWAIPYPVAERLAKPRDLDVDGLIVVADDRPQGAVAGLTNLTWAAVRLDGTRSRAVPQPTDALPRYSGFVAPLELEPVDALGADDLALGLVLPCWTLLGMLDRAIDSARTHVLVREQFGRPLSKFQNVQFQLADAEVERSGLDILAKYSLWSVQVNRAEALDDALSLRMAAIEAADVVLRITHQLHGATGFCDETMLSWLSRYSVRLRQLPFGLSATRETLTNRLGRNTLTGLFSDSGSMRA